MESTDSIPGNWLLIIDGVFRVPGSAADSSLLKSSTLAGKRNFENFDILTLAAAATFSIKNLENPLVALNLQELKEILAMDSLSQKD